MNEQYNLDKKQFFKILLFYNVLIDYIKSDAVKKFNNVKFMSELPFYKDLSIKEVSEAFKSMLKVIELRFLIKKTQ